MSGCRSDFAAFMGKAPPLEAGLFRFSGTHPGSQKKISHREILQPLLYAFALKQPLGHIVASLRRADEQALELTVRRLDSAASHTRRRTPVRQKKKAQRWLSCLCCKPYPKAHSSAAKAPTAPLILPLRQGSARLARPSILYTRQESGIPLPL